MKKVCFYNNSGELMCGNPIDDGMADLWAKDMNAQYPDIVHFTVPVDGQLELLSPLVMSVMHKVHQFTEPKS